MYLQVGDGCGDAHDDVFRVECCELLKGEEVVRRVMSRYYPLLESRWPVGFVLRFMAEECLSLGGETLIVCDAEYRETVWRKDDCFIYIP